MENLELPLLEEILSAIEKQRTYLLPAAQKIQKQLGYLSETALELLSQHFALEQAEVYEVLSFYPDFRFTPPGRNQIKICMGTACHLKGGKIIQERLESKLAIPCGQTTPDRLFSLERVACVGCCSLAPVLVVNEEIIGGVSPIKVEGLIQQLTEEGCDQADD